MTELLQMTLGAARTYASSFKQIQALPMAQRKIVGQLEARQRDFVHQSTKL